MERDGKVWSHRIRVISLDLDPHNPYKMLSPGTGSIKKITKDMDPASNKFAPQTNLLAVKYVFVPTDDPQCCGTVAGQSCARAKFVDHFWFGSNYTQKITRDAV